MRATKRRTRFHSLHFRHQASAFKKQQKVSAKSKTSRVKIANKAGQNQFNKGKNFGAPKQNKRKK